MGKIVFLCTDGAAHEVTLIQGKFDEHVCEDGFSIDAGSGDNGYAIFRRGLTYTVTAGEGTILTDAGYTLG